MSNFRLLPTVLISAGMLTVFALAACASSESSPSNRSSDNIQTSKTIERLTVSDDGSSTLQNQPLAAEAAERKGGKVVVAAPAKVCRAAGGEFNNSFPVMNLGEPFLQVITSIELNEKLVKTGDKLQIKVIGNGKTLSASALRKRTSEFVVTDNSGFSHILLFSGQTIKIKVIPGEKLSIQDPFMRNFGRRACVKLRPERIPEA